MISSRLALVMASAAAACAAVAYVAHPAVLFPEPGRRVVTFDDSTRPRAATRAAAPKSLVYVAGDVVHPGVYPVRADARAADALALAGGAKPDADLVAVNLAAHVADGDEIAVPRIGETTRAHPRTSRSRIPHARGRHRRAPSPATVPAAPADALLDLNTAGADALAALPGLGPALAERIVAFRETNGRFDSVDELADVSGVTPSRLDKILPYVTVGAVR